MKVFAFVYNPMIEESAWATISIHKTKKGAEMAMQFHKNECEKSLKSFMQMMNLHLNLDILRLGM